MRFRTAGFVSATRHSSAASFCLLSLALLAFSGCYLPPFDEKLSESEQFAAGLSPVTRLGPVEMDESKYEDGYFLPSREFDASASLDGYWVRRSGTELQAAYISGSSIYESYGTSTNALAEGFVAFPLTELETGTLSDTTPDRGIFTIFGNEASSGILARGTDASFGLSKTMDPIGFLSVPSGTIVGASYRIESSMDDLVSILYQSASSPPVFSGGAGTAASSNDWTAEIDITLNAYPNSAGTVPALKPGVFFGYCSDNGWYYVSGYRKDDSSLYSAYWPGQLDTYSPVKLPAVSARIAAILSTDRLLAIGNGVMYLYTLSGSLVTSFTTGSMHFAYEYYDSSDGVWYCYFTRAVRVKEDGSDGEVIVDLYRCRSDSLDSLGS